MLVFIKTEKNVIPIEVSTTDTVENLKIKIEAQEGSLIEQQHLEFCGKNLENDKRLE
jgi:hypothetical protein